MSYDQSPIIVVKRKNEIAMLSSSQPATVETCPTPNEGEIISSLIGINHEDFSKRSDTLLIRVYRDRTALHCRSVPHWRASCDKVTALGFQRDFAPNGKRCFHSRSDHKENHLCLQREQTPREYRRNKWWWWSSKIGSSADNQRSSQVSTKAAKPSKINI